MKLTGLNSKGLRVFPKMEKELFPSYHKHGAIATWTQVTDQLRLDFSGKEISGFKYNMGLHAFLSPFYPYATDEQGVLKTGRIGFGIYMQTEYWRVPNVPDTDTDAKKFAPIADYNATTWTQKAVDAGLITADLIGTTKPADFPNHGQQMFDFTNGKYGHDYVNNVAGEIDTVRPLIEYYMNWFKDRFGYYPSVASYGYGRRFTAPEMGEYFMGVRNSANNYDEWAYDMTKLEANSKAITTRQHDAIVLEGITIEASHLKCKQALETAITNNGWYTDFTHWHTSLGDEFQNYISGQRQTIAGRDVITLDYGVAVEHLFLRNMVRRIHLYTVGNKVSIAVDVKNDENLPLQALETSLSVVVDLTGTVLENVDIKGVGDKGIRKMLTNQFIVEVPYNKKDGFLLVTLEETVTPLYLDFTLPSITSVTKTGNVIEVVTNKPTNLVLYKTPLSGALHTATVLKRNNVMTTAHTIDVTGIDFSSSDVYVGVITKEKQSILSAKYNF